MSKDSTWEEVERAYRKQAAKHHPDMGGDAWAFQQVQQAFAIIKRERGAGPQLRIKQPTSSGQPSSVTSAGPQDERPAHRPVKQPNQRDVGGARELDRAARPSQIDPASSPKQRFTETTSIGRGLWNVLFGQLPLQNETTTFILVNALDIFMTYVLLRYGAIEANPIADFFFRRWNFSGMVFFKMIMVAFVTVLAQVIARYKIQSARRLLQFGALVVGIVVVYSAVLFVRHFRGG